MDKAPGRRLLAALIIPWIVVTSRDPCAAGNRRSVEFFDGKRTAGDIQSWGQPDSRPIIEGKSLFDPANPVRWIRNPEIAGPPVPRAFVEFWGGDRLPGRVMGFRQGSEMPWLRLPPHLLVEPEAAMDRPDGPVRSALRIDLRLVRRVLWNWRGQERPQPGTLEQRDGRRILFRSIRWSPDGVRLLQEEGTAEVPFAQIAGIDLPRTDPWEGLYQELAILSPGGKGMLLRIETEGGLLATTSMERFQALSHGDANDPKNWLQRIQPAWSLDPLWIPCRAIRLWRFHHPWEVPLSRIEPARVRQDSPLGGSWTWRADRSVREGPLECAGLEFAWGLGVHATCELTYDLPSSARGFRSLFGLDRTAGQGGCARVSVLGPDADAGPLFRSEILIGSAKLGDTGSIQIPGAPGAPRRLTLQADMAHKDRPALADPLDIRDSVDWLEPLLSLDPKLLEGEVQRRSPRLVPAWQGWTLEGGPAAALVSLRWDESHQRHVGYRLEVRPGPPYLKLTRRLRPGPRESWLFLSANRLSGKSSPSRINVRIDGKTAAEFDTQERGQSWTPEPVLVPLRKSRNRETTIDVFQLQGGPGASVDWQALELLELPPGVLRIFEEEADFPSRLQSAALPGPGDPPTEAAEAVEAAQPAAVAEILQGDGPSATAAIRVPRAAGRLVLSGLQAVILDSPRLGEFRHILFAWRKTGGGRIRLGLIRAPRSGDQVGSPEEIRLEAGEPPSGKAIRVDGKVPEAWTMVTRDLHRDLGNSILQGIVLECPDGEAAFYGHIYLARDQKDLERIQKEILSNPETK